MGRKKHSGKHRELVVGNVMTPTPVCCRPDTSLHDAAALLWKLDVGVLPVVNGAGGGQVSAMITDRDIAMAAYTQARPLHDLHVRAACQGPVHSCRASDDLRRALAVMADAAVRRLVVVDADNHPVGVISLSDIARAASTPRPRRKKLERATCRALSAITAPGDGPSP